jgi:hypothetical protein
VQGEHGGHGEPRADLGGEGERGEVADGHAEQQEPEFVAERRRREPGERAGHPGRKSPAARGGQRRGPARCADRDGEAAQAEPGEGEARGRAPQRPSAP